MPEDPRLTAALRYLADLGETITTMARQVNHAEIRLDGIAGQLSRIEHLLAAQELPAAARERQTQRNWDTYFPPEGDRAP